MDTTAIPSFQKLFEQALHSSPTSGNGWGLALGVILLGAAILGVVGYKIFQLFLKSRDAKDAEQATREKELRDEIKIEKAAGAEKERTAKAEARAEIERERDHARDQRERDAESARERARADHADREAAREKLATYVNATVAATRDALVAMLQRVESAVGALQARVGANDGDIVSLKKDIDHIKDRLDKLEDRK